jgi:hypothetical protein
MSALMSPRGSRRPRPVTARRPVGQSSLFASAAAAAAPAASPDPVMEAQAAPVTAAIPETFETASARRQGPTLDDLVAGAWEGLLAGAPADCLVCGAPLAPRESAGAGVVGGRCDGCGSTLG